MQTRSWLQIGGVVVGIGVCGCQGGASDAQDSGPEAKGTGMSEAPGADRLTVGNLYVQLDHIDWERPVIIQTGRNPFRFGRLSPSSQTEMEFEGKMSFNESIPIGRAQPAGSRLRDSWLLRFIGVVETTVRGEQIAVLSDGDNVFHGMEGDIVDGRYRIMRIRNDSVEVIGLSNGDHRVLRLAE